MRQILIFLFLLGFTIPMIFESLAITSENTEFINSEQINLIVDSMIESIDDYASELSGSNWEYTKRKCKRPVKYFNVRYNLCLTRPNEDLAGKCVNRNFDKFMTKHKFCSGELLSYLKRN